MEALKQHMGLWLPAHEKHLTEWLSSRMRTHPHEMVDGRGTYQYHKLTAALTFVREFGVAIDVGAHCGLWSMHLVKRFGHVHAIEPVPIHRACFKKNVAQLNYTLYEAAAGDREGSVTIHTTDGSSGDSWVDPAKKEGSVPLLMIDRLEIEHVDFIKLDTEGFELPALRGARELIERCRPCIIVEQKPGRAQKHGLSERGAVEYLQSLGAVLRQEISGDFIMSWDEAPVRPAYESPTVTEVRREDIPEEVLPGPASHRTRKSTKH